jgi:hypothetical protein
MNKDEKIKIIPTSMRSVYRKAMTGKSKSAGIKAFCQECMGYVKKEVTLCTSPNCPLFPYRPYQKEDESDDVVNED